MPKLVFARSIIIITAAAMVHNRLCNPYKLVTTVAGFEYVSLPMKIMWGFLIWHEIPTLMTLAGAAVTLASGLYVFYRAPR